MSGPERELLDAARLGDDGAMERMVRENSGLI